MTLGAEASPESKLNELKLTLKLSSEGGAKPKKQSAKPKPKQDSSDGAPPKPKKAKRPKKTTPDSDQTEPKSAKKVKVKKLKLKAEKQKKGVLRTEDSQLVEGEQAPPDIPISPVYPLMQGDPDMGGMDEDFQEAIWPTHPNPPMVAQRLAQLTQMAHASPKKKRKLLHTGPNTGTEHRDDAEEESANPVNQAESQSSRDPATDSGVTGRAQDTEEGRLVIDDAGKVRKKRRKKERSLKFLMKKSLGTDREKKKSEDEIDTTAPGLDVKVDGELFYDDIWSRPNPWNLVPEQKL